MRLLKSIRISLLAEDVNLCFWARSYIFVRADHFSLLVGYMAEWSLCMLKGLWWVCYQNAGHGCHLKQAPYSGNASICGPYLPHSIPSATWFHILSNDQVLVWVVSWFQSMFWLPNTTFIYCILGKILITTWDFRGDRGRYIYTTTPWSNLLSTTSSSNNWFCCK